MELCNATVADDGKMPFYREVPQELIRIRENTTSFFVTLTEVVILLTMAALTLFNTFYVSNRLREY